MCAFPKDQHVPPSNLVDRRASTTRWANVCYRIYHLSAMLSLYTPRLRRLDQPRAGHGTATGGASREQPVSSAPNRPRAARARSSPYSSRTSRVPRPPRSAPRGASGGPHRVSASWSPSPLHAARRRRLTPSYRRPGLSPRALPSSSEHPGVCGRRAGLPPGARGAYLWETGVRTYGRPPAYLRETGVRTYGRPPAYLRETNFQYNPIQYKHLGILDCKEDCRADTTPRVVCGTHGLRPGKEPRHGHPCQRPPALSFVPMGAAAHPAHRNSALALPHPQSHDPRPRLDPSAAHQRPGRPRLPLGGLHQHALWPAWAASPTNWIPW